MRNILPANITVQKRDKTLLTDKSGCHRPKHVHVKRIFFLGPTVFNEFIFEKVYLLYFQKCTVDTT